MSIPILIDCDPGHDDMVAIMVAVASPQVKLLGITTVAGNQIGEKTALNACKVATLVGRTDIPIARGCDAPMVRPLRTAPDIHGESGLDGAEIPDPEVKLQREHAVDFLERTLREAEQPVTLVPTGPLTNIGMLLRKAPDVASKIQRIVLMGGGIYDSNVTPAAEFNILVDPEAADIVFTSGVPITMVGLDVTNRAMLGSEDFDALERMGGRVSSIVAPLLRFFAGTYEAVFGFYGAPLHDALAVAAAFEPDIVTTKHWYVAVETAGRYTTGQTLADIYGVTGNNPNADVAMDLNLKRFKELVFETIRTLDRQAPPR